MIGAVSVRDLIVMLTLVLLGGLLVLIGAYLGEQLRRDINQALPRRGYGDVTLYAGMVARLKSLDCQSPEFKTTLAMMARRAGLDVGNVMARYDLMKNPGSLEQVLANVLR